MSILNHQNGSLSKLNLNSNSSTMPNLSIHKIHQLPSINQTQFTRSKFTPKEDRKLRELINVYGDNSWHLISTMMGDKNPRQCRERWLNYLSFNESKIKKPWTKEEDRVLILKYGQIGAKWAKIAHELPGRSDIQVKLRFMKIFKSKKHLFVATIKDTQLIKEQNNEKNQEKIKHTSNNNASIVNSYDDLDFRFYYDPLPSEIIKAFCQRNLEDFIAEGCKFGYLNY